MPQARVGIVVRTKDRPLFVTRALHAVMAQTARDWQVILVNDGGDPGALAQAIDAAGLSHAFDDQRMTTLNLTASIGRSAAFNRGAETLQTEMVCCLDDDDTWEPAFIAELLRLYDDTKPMAPDLGGVASLVTAVREDIVTEKGRESIVRLGTEGLPAAFTREDFFVNPIAYATYRHDLYPVQWMLNRKAVLACGGFPEAFSVMEDRAFMNRFLQRWRLALLDRPLAYHHRRIQRSGDKAQSVAMNTLDNPSYDWRLFSDLAKIEVNTPQDLTQDTAPLSAIQAGDLIRASAATLLKEVNDETSALWHKINGEAQSLRASIEAVDARIGDVEPRQGADAVPEARVWSLWDAVGGGDIGYRLAVQTPFLTRLELSAPSDQPGLLFHASTAAQRAVLQVPQTEGFMALELSLQDLDPRGLGLRCELVVSGNEGYLFETALSVAHHDRIGRKSHRFEESHVHACPAGGAVKVDRQFPASLLGRSKTAKLSIILPRQAHNFRLVLHDLVVSRLQEA
ncbi:glycosyltransferase family 2 protein [Pararhodobacter oceanensis]|uniref:Glycosyltransferase 2-like domain-containing protein n=1 Tax=Pararhodobacter oceanensis TaxID=2172121 RepID=A0A2T8HTM9_9RHOB|nr:glycosyltransferase family A protein [Pararhodobacter oceanensis]PVH28775.1 hypothetical protein DDE20_11410 [Pararhodobacter oceanensis]